MAADTGGEINPDVTTEDFAPLVWMCDSRVVYDDEWQPGTTPGEKLIERQQNYAFEGESIKWKVLVMDKNGVEKIQDVFATVGSGQGAGNDIEVNCNKIGGQSEKIPESCNARIGEEEIDDFDSDIMEFYECTLNVETADSMYGEQWITVEAMDIDGLSGTMDENEYWFLNPKIALTIQGDLTFEDVRPGTTAYSDTILIGNDDDGAGTGVRLEMYIAGTNFFDSSSSGAMCPDSNVLELENFRYFATNGYSSTANVGGVGPYNIDSEGYSEIPYGDQINEAKEIIGTEGYSTHIANNVGNVLTPGSEMALTFRLDLPEPCNGDFDTGSIYFWGEAI
ncbi:MAG: hypothetical protein PHH54_01150 [Candidatus Nanoarchaeia archaeon]|nr:hypothetical protein [Candidatus Nanoarchaeia archaeon]MDD5740571.1 hypothetical protein [Candidatus Nanoarchaeia archaeon]